MRNYSPLQEIYHGATTLWADFTASATTQLLTSVAHGLRIGDKVQVSNSGGGLPGGLSASTNYWVCFVTADTFQLSATEMGSAITLTTAGTGTQTFKVKGKVIYVDDFKHLELLIATSNNANFTMKVQGTLEDTANTIDFNSARSITNPWEYINIVDLNDRSTIVGDTGLAFAGLDDYRLFEINTNALSRITIDVSLWTAGNLYAALKGYSEF